MKLKALMIGALLATGTFTASAQSAREARFSVTGGMNVTNITNLSADSKLGFNFGFRGEYNFTKNFYANAGLLWSMKGAKQETELLGKDITVKYNPSYLEIPIAFGGRYIIDSGLSIFAETGPYLAVGVCGKCKVNDSDIDFFGDGEDNFGAKRFDAGWGLRAGVEVNKFQIHLGYEHGFVDLGDDCKNWNFNVGLSYIF